MRRALALARRGLGRTSPNPAVGAVVVRGDAVVGAGYHRAAGTEHAEVVALAQAGAAARGAELFVNLEPCCHQGRTGPCTATILASGVRRVVVGMIDPNPLVNGTGLRELRASGLELVVGVLESECKALNAPFVCAVTQGRPLVTLKSALTLDGRTATRAGLSRWITGAEARAFAHQLRNTHDAIAVGVGTVLRDDPGLDCRGVRGGRDPSRVVVDSQLRTPPRAKVVALGRHSAAPTLIVTTRSADPRRRSALEQAGAQLITVASERGRVKIPAMLSALCRRGLLSVLLEGGPTLAGTFWRKRLVDRLVALLAPKVLGDPAALPMIQGAAVAEMADAVLVEPCSYRRLGHDMAFIGGLSWPVPRKSR